MKKYRCMKSAVIILTVFLCLSCTNRQETFEPFGINAKNQKVLRVGLAPEYPPLVSKQGNRLAGLEVDMAKLIAYDLNRKIIFVELAWQDLIPALLNGDIDVIMSGMSITATRENRVKFIQPYLEVGQMGLIRKNESGDFPNKQAELSFRGRVGYVVDTTGAKFVRRHYNGASQVAMNSVAEGVSALRAGRIDLFIHDAPTVWRIAGNTTEVELSGLFWPLTDEFLAWAVRPEDNQMFALLNASLANMKNNGKLQALINKWLPVRVDING